MSHMPLRYLVWGQAIGQAIHVAARAAVADRLQAGPQTAAQLAMAAGVHAGHLARVLRLLCAFGLFTEDEDGRFAVTEDGAQLQTDHPRSLRARAMLNGAPFIWQAWGGLFDAVTTGVSAFEQVHGAPFFDHLAQTPVDAGLFHEAMTSATKAEREAVLMAYDFTNYDAIVDLGGGHGELLRHILKAYPHARGILCDLPHVVADAHHVQEAVAAGRCHVHGGDFFHSVPRGDLYILKQILHDWDDEQAVRILRNCRNSMRGGGKVLHIGVVMKPANEPDMAKLIDVAMLALQTGRERTEDEFRALFAKAGLTVTRVLRVGEWLGIVEGEASGPNAQILS